VALEAAPHFSAGSVWGMGAKAVLLAKGSLSLEMALRLVWCRPLISVYRVRLLRVRLSRWRWQTVRSSFSWELTSTISLFLAMMKLISELVSSSSESSLPDSDRACSHWLHRLRHFSFSADSCFTFSLI
jgi:hypothetical protein